jgi:membrane-bound lytic murein transglycosylase B
MCDTAGEANVKHARGWLALGLCVLVVLLLAGRPALAGQAPETGSATGPSVAPVDAQDRTAEAPRTLATPKPANAADMRFTREELKPLLSRLEGDGFARDLLQRVFYDERLHRIDRVITYNLLNPDSARIYEQFLEPFAIKLARGFHRRHEKFLADIQARTSVSPEIIVGILLVETQFGTAALRYRLLEVFTTLIVDANPAAVDRYYDRLKADEPGLDRAWVEERLAKKAAWAYDELKAFLSIRDRIGVASLYEVKGSYAGAFGMPQFMPSSYAQWAVDGDDDRRVDLDDAADAMASIANFLVQHGWSAESSLEQKMRSVWEYNRSVHYVNTIFGIALGMQRPPRKRGHALPDSELAADVDSQRIDNAAGQIMSNPYLPASPDASGAAAPASPARKAGPPATTAPNSTADGLAPAAVSTGTPPM